jgi:hypothetical protein
MGADLIGIIAVGPKDLNDDEGFKGAVVDTAHQHIARVRESLVRLVCGAAQGVIETHHPRYPNLTMSLDLSECKPPTEGVVVSPDEWFQMTEDEQQDLLTEVCEEGEYVEPDMAHVILMGLDRVEHTLCELHEVWRAGARDVMRRPLPQDNNLLIVCAGEPSWGNEPEGLGYTTLRNAFALGIAQAYGLK